MTKTPGLKKLECTLNPVIAADLLCQLAPSRHSAILSMGVTLLTTQQSILAHIQQSKRIRNNVYLPLGIDLHSNVCESNEGVVNLFTKTMEFLLPDFKSVLKSVKRKCPYQPERLVVENLTVPNSQFMNAMFKGDIKLFMRFYNDDNETIFSFNLFVLTN
jgi:hypothetical protein